MTVPDTVSGGPQQEESSPSLIRLEGISKVFYTDEVETHALSGIHLAIQPGEYLSIAGPSGCGKSTLLSLLGLLDTPTDGEYWLAGRDVANDASGETERRAGEFHSLLRYGRFDAVVAGGLVAFLDDVIARTGDLSDRIGRDFLGHGMV